MGQALYRTNRPRRLKDVVGQEHITHTLENALKKGAISHAYLFTGPRGVGKTSVARILAHEINGLPYSDDSIHLDIIEIDAASNRGIDEIRELRDRVNIAPTNAKYKVYIIDEVHMLTLYSFNALLKTLEEPPAHVVFILATTEAHKLPETIVSRTQRFTFKPVPREKVVKHLRDIAKQEKIDVTDEALGLMAEHGEGSFRDSISLLDQAAGYESKVDEVYVRTMLGIPPREAIESLADGLEHHDAAGIVRLLNQLSEQGYTAPHIAKQLGVLWRTRILDRNGVTASDFSLLQRLLDVPASYDPNRYLEIVLLDYALSGKPVTPAPVQVKQSSNVKQAVVEAPKSKTESVEPTEQPTAGQSKDSDTAESPSESTSDVDESTWPQVLAELKKRHNTLYGVVRTASPKFNDSTLELGFTFAFHRKILNDAKNQAVIKDIIKKLTGQSVSIETVEGEGQPVDFPEAAELSEAATDIKPAKADISSISNIFGGGELLES